MGFFIRKPKNKTPFLVPVFPSFEFNISCKTPTLFAVLPLRGLLFSKGSGSDRIKVK
jgi:hypothetical protein